MNRSSKHSHILSKTIFFLTGTGATHPTTSIHLTDIVQRVLHDPVVGGDQPSRARHANDL
jgi:hypothetical protein